MLTSAQILAIVMLLQAFGVGQETIDIVRAEITPVEATSTPSVISPPIIQTQNLGNITNKTSMPECQPSITATPNHDTFPVLGDPDAEKYFVEFTVQINSCVSLKSLKPEEQFTYQGAVSGYKQTGLFDGKGNPAENVMIGDDGKSATVKVHYYANQLSYPAYLSQTSTFSSNGITTTATVTGLE